MQRGAEAGYRRGRAPAPARWLLCDYGQVLSMAPSPEERAALQRAAGRDDPGFWADYWARRPAYDSADLSAAEYWAAVLGTRPAAEQLDRLVALDTAGWLHPNPRSLAAAGRARDRGVRLAILSNAPAEVGSAIDACAWLAPFSPRLFSFRLRAVKPDAAAYAAALAALGAAPGDVVFLDDRPANVAGARRAGLRAEVFHDPSQIDAVAGDAQV